MKSLLSLAVAVSLSISAVARAGSLVDVSVIDRDTGTTLPTYAHDGKLYVAGTPGHRYGVRLVNRTGARVLTVLSVDGVNAITGESADPNQSGYVLGAYDSTEVDGWRKNMSEVAEFNFTNLGDSYAARTGRPNNVGVIGVAVFREKPHYTWRERDEKIAREAPMPSAADSAGYARKDAAPPPARPCTPCVHLPAVHGAPRRRSHPGADEVLALDELQPRELGGLRRPRSSRRSDTAATGTARA